MPTAPHEQDDRPVEFGVREVRIRAFRSARAVGFAPGRVCALVGGPGVGKSNVLYAIWTLLEHGAPGLATADLSAGSPGPIRVRATLADGDEIALVTSPSEGATRSGRSVTAFFLPASERSAGLIAPTGDEAGSRIAATYFADGDGSSAGPAAALVRTLERLCEARERGIVLLIEEPELFLRPQAQRYLYRLLRSFAEAGNQVLYSTHAPAFLNVGRLDELALVEYGPESGTTVVQPEPLSGDESFRALGELDAERSELLLARAVLLVEGRTEKVTLPFVFRALGRDADREAISIVECGGKPNMPLFIRICRAARVPFVAIHDRDAPRGRKPILSERILNGQIAELAGPGRVVELAPDFEGVAGLRGHSHKPAHAWRRFSTIAAADVPAPLREAVERAIALAQE